MDYHVAGRVDLDYGGTVAHLADATGGFDYSGYTDADEGFAGLAVALGFTVMGVLAHLQNFVEGEAELAGVVGEAGAGGVGEGIVGNEVAAADFGGVHVQRVGDEVEGALHHECAFRGPGTAVGARGWAVGNDAVHGDVHVGYGVGAVDAADGVVGGAGGGGEVVASEVGNHAETHTENCAVGGYASFNVAVVAAGLVGKDVLPSVFNPLDGAFELNGQVGEDDFFGP